MATLTGVARVALGPEVAALFCNDDGLARDLLDAAAAEEDPMWRLPLWRPYRKMIDSKVADINNGAESPHAGAIIAALYLQEFVEPGIPWAHLDVMAWNPRSAPAAPKAPKPPRCVRSAPTSRNGSVRAGTAISNLNVLTRPRASVDS